MGRLSTTECTYLPTSTLCLIGPFVEPFHNFVRKCDLNFFDLQKIKIHIPGLVAWRAHPRTHLLLWRGVAWVST